MAGKRDRSHMEGHRSRLRTRYRAVGDAGLADHELLELLLTYAIPRRDTKELAKRLLARFGSLAGVLEADAESLEQVEGIGPAAATLVSLVRPLSIHLVIGKKPTQAVLKSPEAAAAFFQTKLKGLPEEEVHAAFVNAKNAVTATECLQRGTVDQSAVYVRQIIERALAHKASGFILAHNHPSGDPSPSDHDRELTQAVKAAAATVGIRFLDHLIIGDATPFSFKANGLL
jgi:DNA repair protein RadC